MKDNLNQPKEETSLYSNKNLVCGGCGKYGHVRENFRIQKRGNSNRCNRCGKTGHIESNFWGNKNFKHVEKQVTIQSIFGKHEMYQMWKECT